MRARRAQRELQLWQSHRDELAGMVDAAETFRGMTATEAGDIALQLKHGELVVVQVEPVGLVESRRGPGHYQGGSSGFSFRVAKGINYRIGATKGSFVQGEERLEPIDSGTLVVTTTRAVFLGGQSTREWDWSKLLSLDHDTPSVTLLHVSNRQKVSGILASDDVVAAVRFRLELAVALFNGTEADLATRLRHELEGMDATRPGGRVAAPAIPADPPPVAAVAAPTTNSPGSPPPPAAPAAWVPDPTGRHELRYWDGAAWTAHVSDRGAEATDPL
jgi:Protein of unknown function (DUF2510)